MQDLVGNTVLIKCTSLTSLMLPAYRCLFENFTHLDSSDPATAHLINTEGTLQLLHHTVAPVGVATGYLQCAPTATLICSSSNAAVLYETYKAGQDEYGCVCNKPKEIYGGVCCDDHLAITQRGELLYLRTFL